MLVQPRLSRILHRISKILFALSADELLAILEGKIRATLFFRVQSGKITVCGVSFKSICFDFFTTYIGSSVIRTRTSNGFDVITH